ESLADAERLLQNVSAYRPANRSDWLPIFRHGTLYTVVIQGLLLGDSADESMRSLKGLYKLDGAQGRTVQTLIDAAYESGDVEQFMIDIVAAELAIGSAQTDLVRFSYAVARYKHSG